MAVPIFYMRDGFNFTCWEILHNFFVISSFFKINVFKKSFRNTIRVSNRLDPDVGPDLCPKLFAKAIADNTSRQRVIKIESRNQDK